VVGEEKGGMWHRRERIYYIYIIKIIRFTILEAFIGLIIPNNNSVIVIYLYLRLHLTNH